MPPSTPHGFYEDMPFLEYVSVPALNGSSIVNMRRSPMAYRHYKDNPNPPSAAMIQGVIVHQVILEPQRLQEFAVWGELSSQKVRNGKAWAAFKEENAAKTIVTKAEYDAITGTAMSALKNEPIRKYADAPGVTEVSMFWQHPRTKRTFKCRIDKLIPESHTIFDLKTTRDCHSYKFGSQSFALGYHIKLALYWRVYKELTGVEPKIVMGAVDSKAPHESAVYRVTRDVILQGLDELDHLVGKIEDCEKSGKWPAEHTEESDLILPAWASESDFTTEESM